MREVMIMENRIRALREDRDLRQIDVAETTGIDQRTLSNYETGRTNPDSVALIRLADFFGVSVDALLMHDTPKSRSRQELAEQLENVSDQILQIAASLKQL